MRISPINNNQTNFKAVNQKYLEWAKKEAKGVHRLGELLFNTPMSVAPTCKTVLPICFRAFSPSAILAKKIALILRNVNRFVFS